jgi:hypothetical protein
MDPTGQKAPFPKSKPSDGCRWERPLRVLAVSKRFAGQVGISGGWSEADIREA